MDIDWKDGFLIKYSDGYFFLYASNGVRVASTQETQGEKLRLDCCLEIDQKVVLLHELIDVLYYKNEANEYIVKIPRIAQL